MNVLHDTLQSLLADVPIHFVAQDLAGRLRDQGIPLSERDVVRLERHLHDATPSPLFRLRRRRWWQKTEVVLEFTQEDAQRLRNRLAPFHEHGLAALIRAVIDDTADAVYANLRHRWSAQSRWQRRQTSGFRTRLEKRWRVPLERLRMLLAVSREFGDGINAQSRATPDNEQVCLVEALTRSHARACQVTDEVIALLESGFADGAMARWRTLHEIAVVARLAARHGEALAKRFVEHQVVESFRAATDYHRCQPALGYEPIEDSDLQRLSAALDDVVARYGPTFKGQYGWAAALLAPEKPTFARLEEAAGVGHLRAHYRMASHNVHANPKGVFFKLGLMAETEVLLTGPSNAGLADPGHCAAISLCQVSAALSTLAPSLDNVVAMRVMLQLETEIGRAFGAADEQLRVDAT